MRETEPQVFLISQPSINWGDIYKYLKVVGGGATEWANRVHDLNYEGTDSISDAEALVEFAGRLCYRSWKEGLNPNVVRIRKDSKVYFANILSSRHGSVLEHAQFSFVFHNVSRVFTHELITHRVGMAKSQESLRYVRLTELGFRIPPALEPLREQVISIVEQLEEFQKEAADKLGLDDEGVPFHVKKEITSALRRLAPIGLSTGVLWSANIRTLRFCVEARTAPGAEEEIRLVFDKVGSIMKAACPLLFQDFERGEDGTWVPEHSKV
jgi:thymidylate synthase (FAD)